MFRTALTHGIRWIRRRPASSLVSTACLALGMAVTAMSWVLIDAVLRHPYGLSRVDELAVFWESDRANGRELIELSWPDVRDWQARARSFDSLAAMGSSHWPGLARIRGETVSLASRAVSQSFFSTLGAGPQIGRTFDDQDLLASNPPPIILSHALWRSRFASDPGVVGLLLFVDGIDHRVIGVMPAGFAFPEAPDAWISVERALARAFEAAKLNEQQQRQLGVLMTIGRLRHDTSIDRARAELREITADMRRVLGPVPAGWTVAGTPFPEALLGGVGRRTWIALWMSAGVFAFACANVAAVRLALGAERKLELLARLSLGASRRRIATELALETVPLIALAVVLAAGLSVFLSAVLRLVPAIAETGLPFASEFGVVAPPLGLLTFMAWVAIGAAPAMWLSLKLDASRLTMARHTFTTHRRVGATIVGAQVALAVITVALAGAAVQTFERLSRVDVGFATAGVTIADFALQGQDAGQVRAIHERLQRGLASLPGVTAVGGTSLRPFRFGEIGDGLPVRRQEDAAVEVDRALVVNRIVTSGQYFEALGLPLLQGRAFSTFDRAESEPVVVVSRGVAQALWGGTDAVGRRIETFTLSQKWRSRLVIGVVGDARYRSLLRPPLELYMPDTQSAAGVSSYVIRTADGRALSDAEVRAAFRQADPDIAVQAVQPTGAIVRTVLGPSAFVARMLSLLGASGLVLLALGVFGAVAVQLRAALREIGVRQSLGATPIRASTGPLRILAVAVVGGAVAGVGLTPLVLEATSQLGLVNDASAAVQAAVALAVVVLSALLASWPSIRRVARVSPAVLLRQD
jgi:putative ABC transport system permease protein